MPLFPTQDGVSGPQGISFLGQQISVDAPVDTIISLFTVQEKGESNWLLTCDDPFFEFPPVYHDNPISFTVSAAGVGNLTAGSTTVNITVQDQAGSQPVTFPYTFDIASGATAPTGLVQSPTAVTILANAAVGDVLADFTTVGGVGPFVYTVDNANLTFVGNQLRVASGASFSPNSDVHYKVTTTDSASGLLYTDPTNRTAHVPAGPSAFNVSPSSPSISETAPAGTTVWSGIVSGGTLPITPTDLSGNTKFDLFVSGNTVTCKRSSTGTVAHGVDETQNIQITDAAGLNIPAPVGVTTGITTGPSAVFVTTHNIAETDGSATDGYKQFGMRFVDGDIPAGWSFEFRKSGVPIVIQVDDRRAYETSGALKRCVVTARDTNWASLEDRSFDVYAVNTPFVNNGTKTLADLIGATDFNVKFTSVTQTDGVTSTTRGSGAFTASLNAFSVIPQNVTKTRQGDVIEEFEVFGHAVDNVLGTPDPDLTINFYAGIWKKADGSVFDYWISAGPGQFQWASTTKYQLKYNATLCNGASVIGTYNNVVHNYRAIWQTVRNLGIDNWDCCDWWLNRPGGKSPTLISKPNRAYLQSTGLFPPYDFTFGPNSLASRGYSAAYIPGGKQNHKGQIAGTGPYPGRCVGVTLMDMVAFITQNVSDIAIARASAFAGLHIPLHYRTQQTRQRPANALNPADPAPYVGNCVFSLNLDPSSSAAYPTGYDCTAEGMAAPVDAYWVDDDPAHSFGYTKPLGGNNAPTDPWDIQGDNEHAVSYCLEQYNYEGRRYFLYAMIGLAMKSVQSSSADKYSGLCSPLLREPSSNSIAVALSIPGTLYHGTGYLRTSSERNAAWQVNIIGPVSGAIPDEMPERSSLWKLSQQQCTYLKDNMDNWIPPSLLQMGFWCALANPPFKYSTWEVGFCSMAGEWSHSWTGLQTYQDWARMCARLPYGEASRHIYRMIWYRTSPIGAQLPWDPVTNDFLPFGHQLSITDSGSIVNSVFTLEGSASSSNLFYYTDGDVFYPQSLEPSPNIHVPPELTEGTPYYAVNASGLTCQLSASPGGPPINFADFCLTVTLTGVTGTFSVGQKITQAGTGAQGTITSWNPGTGRMQLKAWNYKLFNATGAVTSTTGAGTAIACTNNSPNFMCDLQAFGDYAVQSNPPYISAGDSYGPAGMATSYYSYIKGNPEISPTVISEIETFFSSLPLTGTNGWRAQPHWKLVSSL